MTTTSTPDVLIVGGGPAGTTMGIELLRRGVSVRILDKAPSSFPGSRAKGVQPRTQEVFDDLGVLTDIHAAGSLYPKMGIHVGPLTVPYSMIKTNTPSDDIPYPSTWLIPQYSTDRVLHDRLEALGGSVEYNCELTELVQDESSVTATVVTPSGVETITTTYLVGADGGSSVVRKKAGIAFEGTTDEEDRMLIVDAVVEGTLSRNRWHIWPVAGLFMGACPLPNSDLFQWMITLESDEDAPTTAEQITARVRARTKKKLTLTNIMWRSVFRPNIRIAERYRAGRVFLVGDAAHVHPPAGAQGLNTGVQDSYNLAWKIAQVLEGGADRLLDSYQSERQPIAATVLGISAEKYAGIASANVNSLKRGKDEYQLAVSYAGGPLAHADAGRTSAVAAGDRVPDARLMIDGAPGRLFQLLRGTHFTAIAFGDRAAGALGRVEWPQRGATLRTIVIDATGASADHYATDIDGNFRRTYGLSESAILLVRPDGYVAAVAADGTVPASVVPTVTGMVTADRKSG